MVQIIKRISSEKYKMVRGGSFFSYIAVGIIAYASDSFGPGGFTWPDKLYLVILAAFIGSLVPIISTFNAKSVMKECSKEADQILQKSINGDFVETFFLYLRPFYITGQLLVNNPFRNKFLLTPDYFQPKDIDWEYLFGNAVEAWAPLLALGKPTETIGATRIYSMEDKWKKSFCALAEKAAIIFIIPSSCKGTLWEINWLKRNKKLSKCIFVIPDVFLKKKPFLPGESLEDIANALNELDIKIPHHYNKGIMFRVDQKNDSCIVRNVYTIGDEEELKRNIQALAPIIHQLSELKFKNTKDLQKIAKESNKKKTPNITMEEVTKIIEQREQEKKEWQKKITEMELAGEFKVETLDIENTACTEETLAAYDYKEELKVVFSFLKSRLEGKDFSGYLSPIFSRPLVAKEIILNYWLMEVGEKTVSVKLVYKSRPKGKRRTKIVKYSVSGGVITLMEEQGGRAKAIINKIFLGIFLLSLYTKFC